MSNFDISGYGGIANYTECAVKPQDYHKIHKVSIMFYVKKDGSEGILYALHIQDKQGTTLMKTARFDSYLNHPKCKVKEVILQDNERLLGVTSAAHPNYKTWGCHLDFQFVIGRKPEDYSVCKT
jgi:hypothetical protein